MLAGMRIGRLGGVLITGAWLLGCGSKEHAQLINLAPSATRSHTDGGSETSGMADGSGAGDASTTRQLKSPDYALKSMDPDKVYVLGQKGSEDEDCKVVLADITDPNHYDPAVRCGYPVKNFISRDGYYYMTVDGTLFNRFVPDYNENYDTPYANDTPVDAPCSGRIYTSFVMSPGGRIMYQCFTPQGWYDVGGEQILETTDPILALTDHDLVLTHDGVMSLKDKVLHHVPQIGAAYGGFRVHGDTFHMIVNHDLLSVDAQGNVTKLGTYPPTLPNLDHAGPDMYHQPSTGPILTRDDAMIYDGNISTTDLVEALARATIDGKQEIVYSEADNPTVRLHNSLLLTGP